MEVAELSLSWGLSRRLGDVIKDGVMGRSCAPPRDTSPLNSRVNLTDLNLVRALPCFRSHTGWVWRTLSFFEKGLLLDFNELCLQKLEGLSCLSDIFEKALPGKIAQVVNELLLSWFGVPVKAPFTSPAPDVGDKRGGKLLMSAALAPKPSLLKEDPFLVMEVEYLRSYGEKAAKGDEEPVPVELWDRSVLRTVFPWLSYSPTVAAALQVIREKFAWRIYIVNLVNSFFRYLKATYGSQWPLLASNKKRRRLRSTKNGATTLRRELRRELVMDLQIGLDGLMRALRSSWWEWSAGSTCFFWRWHSSVRREVRDGFPVYVTSKLPEFKKKQSFNITDVEMVSLKSKVRKVIGRRYIEPGYVKSLINYFAVPKVRNDAGEVIDIRVVYDGTKSGLTDATWAPNFYMPSLGSLLMIVSTDTWFADMDLGEMFLNYFMDHRLRPFSGVDVTRILGSETPTWYQWSRTFMGFRASPYIAVKSFAFTMDVIRGDHLRRDNPYGYDRIRLNLPGSPDYCPSLPWLSKMKDGDEASDAVTYMDDIRILGSSEMSCRLAAREASKKTQYLGEQDAARKRRPPNKEPGPWCGAFVANRNGSVWVYVSQSKWSKAKAYVAKWYQELSDCACKQVPLELDFKDLEKGHGFLVYLSRTYDPIVPYLKGIHLTLDSWRTGRDAEGWKVNKKRKRSADDGVQVEEEEYGAEWISEHFLFRKDGVEQIVPPTEARDKAPGKVSAVPRLMDDLRVLLDFFEPEAPLWRFVRGAEVFAVQYGFADASGQGFGATFEDAEGVDYRFGNWGESTAAESSNFRELNNLVEALESKFEQSTGTLVGREIFLFTDNQVAEGAFYKGTSGSRKLFELVVRLRKLEMFSGCKIHIVHIAGSRMIAQGTDGLSRGDISEGVMRGASMLEFVPLHLNCLERSEGLEWWIRSWLSPYAASVGLPLHVLRELDWFNLAQDITGGSTNDDGVWIPNYKPAVYVWVPAPSAGQIAVEQLRQARLKRVLSTHVVVIPRIFPSLWKKQLHRSADLVVELPFVPGFWTKETQHEPLTVAFYFPYIHRKPWQLKRSFAFLGMGRHMRRMWQTGSISTRDILLQFFKWTRTLFTLPDGVVRQLLQSASTCAFSCEQAGK